MIYDSGRPQISHRVRCGQEQSDPGLDKVFSSVMGHGWASAGRVNNQDGHAARLSQHSQSEDTPVTTQPIRGHACHSHFLFVLNSAHTHEEGDCYYRMTSLIVTDPSVKHGKAKNIIKKTREEWGPLSSHADAAGEDVFTRVPEPTQRICLSLPHTCSVSP